MSRKRQRFKKEGVDNLDSKAEKKEQEKEEYDAFGFMKDKKTTAAIAGIFFLFGFAISWMLVPSMTGMVINSPVDTNVDHSSIAQDGVDFLNDYFVDGGGVTLKTSEVSGELIDITTDYNGNEIPVYMTTDGTYIILGGVGAVNIEEFAAQQDVDSSDDDPAQPPSDEVPKSDRPKVEIFVMSYCPFGLQMQKAAIPVMELLGDTADIEIKFVHYIMHGLKEIEENNNQYCIQSEQPEKFLDYLTCFVQSDDHQKCASEAGVDTEKMDSCIEGIDAEFNITGLYEDESTWSNGRYPPYMVDAELANQYGVRGSPTVVINGQTVSVSRSPEAVKDAVCNAFNEPPEECLTELSTGQAGSGIGPLEASGTASASANAAACET